MVVWAVGIALGPSDEAACPDPPSSLCGPCLLPSRRFTFGFQRCCYCLVAQFLSKCTSEHVHLIMCGESDDSMVECLILTDMMIVSLLTCCRCAALFSSLLLLFLPPLLFSPASRSIPDLFYSLLVQVSNLCTVHLRAKYTEVGTP